MNLNQAAHGDREFAFIATRLRRGRKTIVGHWDDPAVLARLGAWSRAAAGWHEARRLKVARFGDNMRQVAVTEGDKVEAQARLGFSVNGYGVDRPRRAGRRRSTTPSVDDLVEDYEADYDVAPAAAPRRRAPRRAPDGGRDRGRPALVPRWRAASAPSPTRSRTSAASSSCRASASSA